MTGRLGIDVGGTFTDLLLFDDATGELSFLKTPTTPDNPSVGVFNGIKKIVAEADVPAAEIGTVLHGTTVSTNTVVEGRGAKVGLLVTENFEQVLHLGRGKTPGPLTGWMGMRSPTPLADLELTRGVRGRINVRGDVETPLDEAHARTAIRALIDAGVDSIMVSLLHAYANPVHEKRVRAIAAAVAADVPVSLSSEILPAYGEYERTLVTAMNAYIKPNMQRYLHGFADRLRGVDCAADVSIVRSDGGLMNVGHSADWPVYTLLSGPAGGASGAAGLAALAGHADALGFDMGGTSTDVSVIRDGRPVMARRTSLGDYRVNVPSVAVQSIGAGGGSIAHVPMTGALRIGPQSAGAAPGPACYGRGGEQPTVTDANVVLGRLPPGLLGGEMPLDAAAAEDAVGAVARALDMDLYRTAQGIVDIVNENMSGALRQAAVGQGLEPRDVALVAFGGAGPLHGNAMAMLASCYPVIVPPAPGVLSALGFLQADVTSRFVQTLLRGIDDVEPDRVRDLLDRLAGEADAWLDAENIPSASRVLRYEVDLRYFHRNDEFTLDVDPAGLRDGGLRELQTRFGSAHERRHGFALDLAVELVNVRVVAAGRVAKMPLPTFATESADASAATVEQRQVYFDTGFLATDIYDRDLLRAGNRITGPALVTQRDATTLIHPGHVGEVDAHLNILIRPEAVGHKGRTSHE